MSAEAARAAEGLEAGTGGGDSDVASALVDSAGAAIDAIDIDEGNSKRRKRRERRKKAAEAKLTPEPAAAPATGACERARSWWQPPICSIPCLDG